MRDYIFSVLQILPLFIIQSTIIPGFYSIIVKLSVYINLHQKASNSKQTNFSKSYFARLEKTGTTKPIQFQRINYSLNHLFNYSVINIFAGCKSR
jgi:hypothetical protein